MSTRLPYLKHATDSHRDPWLRSMIREHGDAFHRMYWDLLEMLQADGSGEEVTLLTVNLHDLAAAMMRKPTLVLKFLDVLSSKRNGFVKYKYERTGDELDISAFKFRDYQHNLGSRAGADGNHNGGGSGVDKTRCRQEERVPSIGVESETKTKTPPTQSIIIGPVKPATAGANRFGDRMPEGWPEQLGTCIWRGPLLIIDPKQVLPRFDLWSDAKHTPEQSPVPVPPSGRKWEWSSSTMCWLSSMLHDNRDWVCGIPKKEWEILQARGIFERQRELQQEYDAEDNLEVARQLWYREDDRRTKIREDANGTTKRNQDAMDAAEKERWAKLKADDEARRADIQKAAHKTAPSRPVAHGKAKPDSHRKFFK